MRELFARLVDWFRRDALERDLSEELRHHRELLERDLSEGPGGTPVAQQAVRQAARRRLGNLTPVREAARERWSIPWLDHLLHDLRYAGRALRRSPVFTLTVVLTLALGFGANAAIFSLLDRLFFRAPDTVVHPDSVSRVYVLRPGAGLREVQDKFNYPEWLDLKVGLGSTVASAYMRDSALVGNARSADAERSVVVAYTDASYWSLLGLNPLRGRPYNADEARIEVPSSLVMVSDAFWRGPLGARTDVIGSTIVVGGKPRIVIGVAPTGFAGVDLDATNLWMPLGDMPMAKYGADRLWYQIRSTPQLHVLVHAAAGTGVVPLALRLTTVYRAGSVSAGYESDSSARVTTGPLIAARGPMQAGQELMVSTRLAWVSLLVLIIACANVSNLLLTRLLERRREISLRLALGVTPGRLATQLMAETFILALLSLLAALVVGSWTGGALRATLMPDTHWPGRVIEWRVVVALLLSACVAGLFMTGVLVVHARRFASMDALKGGCRATERVGRRARSILVVAQTALAVILLTGAGLCVESLRHVLAVDTGFEQSRLAYAAPRMLGERGGEDSERRSARADGLREAARRLATIPGVEAVSLTSHGPMAGYYTTAVRVSGRDSAFTFGDAPPGMRDVSPEYWRTVGMRAARGRLTTELDVSGAPLVVVVNETMARAAWPGRNPLGECVLLYGSTTCRTVIGVVRDVHLFNIVEPAHGQLYLPIAQANNTGGERRPAAIVVRVSDGQLPAVLAAMRRTLDELLPNAELGLRSLDDALEPQFRPWRLGATLFASLGVLGLLVASIGLYGMIAYGVRQRLHELGIRLALGAQRERIVWLVMRQGVLTVGLGLALGVILAGALSRFLSSILYETSLRDPLIIGVVTLVMFATGLLASLVPARRAAGVDPNTALRGE